MRRKFLKRFRRLANQICKKQNEKVLNEKHETCNEIAYSHEKIDCNDNSLMKEIVEWCPTHQINEFITIIEQIGVQSPIKLYRDEVSFCCITVDKRNIKITLIKPGELLTDSTNHQIIISEGQKREGYSLKKGMNTGKLYPIFQFSEKNYDCNKNILIKYPINNSFVEHNMTFKLAKVPFELAITYYHTKYERVEEFEKYFYTLDENANPIEIYKKMLKLYTSQMLCDDSFCVITVEKNGRREEYTFKSQNITEYCVQDNDRIYNVNSNKGWKYYNIKSHTKIEVAYLKTLEQYLWDIHNLSTQTQNIADGIKKVEKQALKLFEKLEILQTELNRN